MPADAGLLSALGLAVAVIERFAQRQVLAPLAAVAPRLEGWCAELGREAAGAVAADGVPAHQVAVRRRIVALRFAGREATVPVEYGGGGLAADFAAAYRAVYGYEPEGRPIEVESLRVVASSSGSAEGGALPLFEEEAATAPSPPSRQRAFFAGSWQEVPAIERAAIAVGEVFAGPALVLEAHTATVVESGWTFHLDRAGALVLRRRRDGATRRDRGMRDGGEMPVDGLEGTGAGGEGASEGGRRAAAEPAQDGVLGAGGGGCRGRRGLGLDGGRARGGGVAGVVPPTESVLRDGARGAAPGAAPRRRPAPGSCAGRGRRVSASADAAGGWLGVYSRATAVHFAMLAVAVALGGMVALRGRAPFYGLVICLASLLSMAARWPRRGRLLAMAMDEEGPGALASERGSRPGGRGGTNVRFRWFFLLPAQPAGRSAPPRV